ncbi:SDR family NAD(P)-dependent oxidoreductase [Phenylobacterium sp. LjRoot225]|uniref:SDR family NAD(P)-dependent oxidoreductase n=1 Tax=Phenylobacterium sp. LjRoot225 TaxID=3342285 RepID=UPI003ECD8AB8
MDLRLADKVVVITGAAKGMGAAITLAFAAEGARLVLSGRDMAAIEPVAEAARGMGRSVITVACDITDPVQTEALAAAARDAFGRIDVLVNVAGGTGPMGETAWSTSTEAFEEIVRLNVTGCFNTMKAVLPVMVEQCYGKIVNVGGTFGMRGRAGRMAYSASKWGLRGVTKSTALEAGPHNINVNYVAPGMVEGPRFRTKVIPDVMDRHGVSEAEAVARHADEYALRRITQDEDVANACLFFASDVSRQITGADLAVDGGWAHL